MAKKHNLLFVTVIPDQEGVEDSYVNDHLAEIPAKIRASGDMSTMKRWVRLNEAKLGALGMGVKPENYYNLDFNLPLTSMQKSPSGKMLSYESQFKFPSEKEKNRLKNFIKNNSDAGVYIIPFIFSNHPHHRMVAELLMNAIYAYNPSAKIYFICNEEEYKQHNLKSNVYYFFDEQEQKAKEKIIDDSYVSQNVRQGNAFYVARSNAIAKDSIRSSIDDLAGTKYQSRINPSSFPYAERLIEIKLCPWDKVVVQKTIITKKEISPTNNTLTNQSILLQASQEITRLLHIKQAALVSSYKTQTYPKYIERVNEKYKSFDIGVQAQMLAYLMRLVR